MGIGAVINTGRVFARSEQQRHRGSGGDREDERERDGQALGLASRQRESAKHEQGP